MTEPARIGIIIGKIYKATNRKQLSGILEEAFSRNIHADIFIMHEEHFQTTIGEENLLHMIQFSLLDGVIFIPYSFASKEYSDEIERFLLENCPKPVVRIGIEHKPFVPVWYHDRAEMAEITRHLIEVHHCRNLVCLTGPAQNPVSMERLAGFQEALAEAELPCQEEKNVFYGDFYLFSAQKLAQEFADGARPLPDAVVCANDLMAVSLCDALKKHQISVPDDVLVTGYDGTLESALHMPPVTTYAPSWEQLGRNAMCQLYELITGKSLVSRKSETGTLICRKTCGCQNHASVSEELEFNYPQLEENYIDSSLSVRMLSCTSLETLVKTIYNLNFVFFDPEYYDKEYYALCLCENWDEEKRPSHQHGGYSEQMMRMHYNGGYTLFPITEMTPPDFRTDETPTATFFSALYFQDRCFGYSVLQYLGIADGINPYYLRFCRETSNALEFLRVRNALQSLAYHDYLSQVRDALTGLYKLNHLPYLWKDYLEAVKLRNENCFWIALDIAGLYRLAETGGTLLKDKLLVAFAEYLQNTCSYHEKCLRAGESDFLILGSEPDSSHYHNLLIQNLRDHFEQYQRSQKQVVLPLQSAVLTNAEIQLLTEETVTAAAAALVTQAKSNKATYSEQLHYKELKKVRQQIYQTPEQEWSVSLCSQKLNISSSYFCKIYQRAFGVTCAYDIRRAKMEHGKYLLLHTADTLQEISRKCGYDYSRFMRTFKKFFQMTPTEYRRGK